MKAVLGKRPTGRLPWTTLVDGASLEGFPVELRGHRGLDFYRHLGCDILLLNGWNTPHKLHSPILRWGGRVTTECHTQDGQRVTVWRTPAGCLTSVRERGYPQKYPADSIDAVRAYRGMWEEAVYSAHDDTKAFQALTRLVGDDGVVTRFWGPSAIPRLLEEDMGTESSYYLLADYPDDMDALIRTIHFLTPPPTGDTPWEAALDVMGEDLIIIGCLDPTIFAAGPVDMIGPALDRLITPRLREASFVLSPTADGIPVELERFHAVKRWMDGPGRH